MTDPYSRWQNQAKSEIREVKRLASKWTVKSQSPRRLWDHAIELASILRSHLALDMYKLNSQVPETIMLGQTADISFICSFAWYNWVYYKKQNAAFEAGSVLQQKKTFTIKVNNCLGDPIKDHLVFNDLVKISSVTLSNDESINFTDMTYDPDVMDTYITAEVLLPRGFDETR
jgi:hypothetical protein